MNKEQIYIQKKEPGQSGIAQENEEQREKQVLQVKKHK